MLNVLYKIGDFGAFSVWLLSLLNVFEGGSVFISVTMGFLGVVHLVLVRIYIPYKKNLRDAESHKLDMEEKKLVNKKHKLEIEDEMNEITIQYEEDK